MRGPHAEATNLEAGAEPDSLAPMDRRVLVVAGAVFLILMPYLVLRLSPRRAVLPRRRPASARWLRGPTDPDPLLARVSLSLFGVSLPGLRLWSAVAVAVTVVIGGLLARELGGAGKPNSLPPLVPPPCRRSLALAT